MANLVVHPLTLEQLSSCVAAPAHALCITGAKGAGKGAVALKLAADLLALQPEQLQDYPYFRHIEQSTAIGIEPIRDLERFLRLKVPSQQAVQRVIVIEHADTLTIEAQNALLKTLEEPPEGTILILTAAQEDQLLPTVRSRVQCIQLKRVAKDELLKHFDKNQAKTARAYSLSGGLPGLMHALLEDEAHPLVEATELARALLQETIYKRLVRVDALSKQKPLVEDTLYILQQMARTKLVDTDGVAAARWQQVLSTSYEATESLRTQANTKLVLDKLMLQLG